MRGSREIIVGIVFFGVLFVLGFFTILIGEFSLGGGVTLHVIFDTVNGLEKGNNVLVAGHRMGKVKEVEFLPETGKVRAGLWLKEPIVLWEKYSILIQEATLLGGLLVNIDPGKEREVRNGKEMRFKRADLSRLTGKTKESPLRGIEDLVGENQENIKVLVHGLRRFVDELHERKTAAKMDQAIEKFAQLGDTLSQGKGTLGKLIHEDTLHQELEEVLSSGKTFLDSFKTGRGVLPQLLHDEALARKIENAVARFESALEDVEGIARGVREGKGTLGKLINEDTLHTRLDQFFASGNEILESLREGRGILPRLFQDEALGDKFDETMANIEEISRRMRMGEGSLGKLMAEDALYEQIMQAFKQVEGAVEDARESAPIAVFASALFAVF